nr:hypothetical protein [Streptomyces sp. SID3343]
MQDVTVGLAVAGRLDRAARWPRARGDGPSWKTVTALSDRLPTRSSSPDLPAHPNYPRVPAVFNEATSALRARDVCEALVDHEPLPKNIERARVKLKRLVKPGLLTETGSGSFAKKQ